MIAQVEHVNGQDKESRTASDTPIR